MTKHPDYIDRWEVWFRDALSVNRLGFGANPTCYGTSISEPVDGPSGQLARFVSENSPGQATYDEPFSVRDLMRSALVADDFSVVYRVHLIAHLTRALDDMRLLAAMSQRRNRAQTFMVDYLNRQMSCLGCHNSEFSVTDANTAEDDRSWPIEGPFERLLFLSPTGLSDVDELSGFFRRKGVLAGYHYTHDEPELIQTILGQKGSAPWGWDGEACGEFLNPEQRSSDDAMTAEGEPLHSTFIQDHGVDGTVFDVEAYLFAGVNELKASGPPKSLEELSAEASFAYMVASSAVDQIWAEAFGQRLTIATHFPRNRYQMELLRSLTEVSIRGGFSLREVLVAILVHPYFNGDLPTAHGSYRPVFDPFVNDSLPVSEQRNDLVHTLRRAPARVLLRTVSEALDWPALPEFILYYMSPSARQQRSVGVFLKTGDPGFGGTSFQSALAWESIYGVCEDQSLNGECPLTPILENSEAQLATVKELCASKYCACDWDARCCDIDWDAYCSSDLNTGDPDTLNLCTYPKPEVPAYGDVIRRLAEASLSADATWGEALGALKDRLLADPELSTSDETAVIESLLGVSLKSTVRAGEDVEKKLRLACGLWLSTPDFHLLGDPGPTTGFNNGDTSSLIPNMDILSNCLRLKALLQISDFECRTSGVVDANAN
jgi:hypothetical protein